MIAAARHLGLTVEDYRDPRHDVQVAIRGLLAFLAGMDPDEVETAVDGCAAPTFLLPLRGFALALARLVAAGEGVEGERRSHAAPEEDYEDEGYADDEVGEYEVEDDEELEEDGFPVSVPEALRKVWWAMKAHPVLVAGSRGRICTDVMRVAAALEVPLVAKSGAEGVYAIALVHRDRALGIALKIEDGSERGRNSAALETLFQLGLLPGEAEEHLAGYHRPPVLDRLGEPVGEVRPRFKLNRGLPG
jgi:L-asparaginase II